MFKIRDMLGRLIVEVRIDGDGVRVWMMVEMSVEGRAVECFV